MDRPRLSNLFRSNEPEQQLPDMDLVIDTPGVDALLAIVAERMEQSEPGRKEQVGLAAWAVEVEETTRLVYSMHKRDAHTDISHAQALIDAEDPERARQLAIALMSRYERYQQRAYEYSRDRL
jgi:hypothetical protein